MTRIRVLGLFAILLGGAMAVAAQQDSAPSGGGHVALIEFDGAIGPATMGYFHKAQRQAVEAGASTIVLRIDTPGGLDGSMRDIIKDILASPIPIIGFVAPGGARAASAGTFILYATHLAAMAPATNLGAATPVPVGGGGGPFPSAPQDEEDADGEKNGEDKKQRRREEPKGDAMQAKILNDAVAYIRGLAEKRGRNADWAERAVREGVSLSSAEAMEQNVIELLANDVGDLLQKVDGRVVALETGEVTLQTAGKMVQKLEPDWRMKFLAVLTNPTIAYILMLIGIYGLLLEGYNPGAIVPGVLGAICLLLALFAFQILPVNYVGLGLIILGIVLMIAEALAPSFGALGFGGIAAFIFGSIMLMDFDVPGYEVNLGVVFGIAVAAAAIMAMTLYLLWRSRQAPVTTGDSVALGHQVLVTEFAEGQGWARLGGEHWRIRSNKPLEPGQHARVARVDGLTLVVEPLDK